MQIITNLTQLKVQLVEGISEKTEKPYTILKVVDEENNILMSEFISNFYQLEYFKRIKEEGGNLNVK